MSANVNPAASNPYAPPRARVRDVVVKTQAIVLAQPSARLGAAIVDSLIFTALVYLPLILGTVIAGAGDNTAAPGFVFLGLGLAFVGFVVFSWLTLRQMSATGQSLAKKYFNIKVVLSDGSRAPLSTLIIRRNLLTWILSFIPGYAIIEVLFIFRERRQCLHDRMANTIVVEA